MIHTNPYRTCVLVGEFSLYFLNNGSAVFQTDEYAHLYDDMSQLAEDYCKFNRELTTTGWEGNESESRIEFDLNGSYMMFDEKTINNILLSDEKTGWYNADEFVTACNEFLR